MGSPYGVHSEVGRLRKVLVCAPGLAHRRLTPTNADVLYTGAESFYKSTDGGKTFQTMRTPHGDNHDIWISPKDGNTMIQSNDGGANVSYDGGRTWRRLRLPPAHP